MAIQSFKRIFTDNSRYGNYEHIPYLKSLAVTVQEFLYTSKAKSGNADYNMTEYLSLCDFMSLVAYFITAASSEFGKSTIAGYLNTLEQCTNSPFYEYKIEYTKDQKSMVVMAAPIPLKISLLWAAYLYIQFYYDLSKDEKYKEVAEMLKEFMLEKSCYTIAGFNKLPPIKNTKNALMFMAKYLATHGEGKTQKKTTETKDSATIAQLQNRIAELEAENKALKEKIVQNDNVLLNTNEDSTISSLKDDILFLKKRIKDYEETYKCLPAREAAIFTLAICEEWKQIPNDRQKLWPFMNTLWGFSQTTSEKRLREGIEQSEADNLAKKFEKTPVIARLIREIPEKLQKKKEEDLLAKNPKKKN